MNTITMTSCLPGDLTTHPPKGGRMYYAEMWNKTNCIIRWDTNGYYDTWNHAVSIKSVMFWAPLPNAEPKRPASDIPGMTHQCSGVGCRYAGCENRP